MPYLRKNQLFAFAIIGVLGASQVKPDDIQYRDRDWCLQQNTADLELTFGNFDSIPNFLAPAPFLTLNKFDADSEQGLSVSFVKSSQFSIDHLMSRGSVSQSDCNRIAVDGGLYLLKESGTSNCFLPTSTTYFEPQQLTPPYGTTRIRCADASAVIACHLSYIMPNAWEARVSLPKSDISKWQMAANIAEEFFLDHLEDCG